jgi:DHA1 family bicyclomycin/chloramphenicol resistance-like MFS transporter
MVVNPAVAPPRGRAGAALLVLLGFLTAMGPLSLDMYLPAFPRIAAGLGGAAPVQLSLTACLLGLALGQILAGPLSDRWGRRIPAAVGMAGYAVTSLLCAVAPTAPLFVSARLLQGLAGGVGVVVARAVVRDLYAGTDAARYFSRLTLIFGIAPILAPSLGSLVLRVTSWRGVFVVLAAVGVLLAVGTLRAMPETLPAHRRSTGGLTATGRAARTLLTDRVFVGYALAQGTAFAGLFAYIAASTFVLQEGYGVPAAAFSALFGLNALGLVALSQANRRLLNRRAPRALLVATLLAGLCAGIGVLAAALAGSLVGLCVALFCYVSTVGMVMPNSTALALDRHAGRAGAAAAVIGGIQSVLGAAAAPLVGALGNDHAGTAMGIAVLGCAALAVAAVLTLTRKPVA